MGGLFYLTLFFLLIQWPCHEAFARFSVNKDKGVIRWAFEADNNDVNIKKISENSLSIYLDDLKLFNNVKNGLENKSSYSGLIEKISFKHDQYPNGQLEIIVKIKKNKAKYFSFYDFNDRKQIIDFWMVKKYQNEGSNKKSIKVNHPVVTKLKNKAPRNVKKIFKKNKELKKIEIVKGNRDLRDFRYGAPFILDYEGHLPPLPNLVSIERKTPEYFYEIPMLEEVKSEEDGHYQLILTLYKKKKWGLMNKAIELYNIKYPGGLHSDIYSYLKANVLMRGNFKDLDNNIMRRSIEIYEEVLSYTKNEKLKKTIYKYLIQYYLDKEKYFNSLVLSKKYFDLTNEKYQIEEQPHTVKVMLYSLAKLGQFDKIQTFIDDSLLRSVLGSLDVLSYKIFSLLSQKKFKDVIRIFGKIKKNIVDSIGPDIIFNLAESYFQIANYKESIKFFDIYLNKFSYLGKSDQARLRIALSYELSSYDKEKIIKMYREVIDKSTDKRSILEAKIRLASIAFIRPFEKKSENNKYLTFLKFDKNERKEITGPLAELLWIVRLRTLIVQENYTKGYLYYTTIPLRKMKSQIRRVFEDDGSEIIFGIIKDSYQKGLFFDVVRYWEKHRKKYFDDRGKDPELYRYIAKSYHELGLFDGLERLLQNLVGFNKRPGKNYPLWIPRKKVNLEWSSFLSEFKLMMKIKLGEFIEARKILAKLLKDKKFKKADYYEGIIDFEKKDYKSSLKKLSDIIMKDKGFYDFSEIERVRLYFYYLESLYQGNHKKRFNRYSKHFLTELIKKIDKVEEIKYIHERISYLRIEMNSENRDVIEFSKKYLDRYEKSPLASRVQVILADIYKSSGDEDLAKEAYNKIINNKAMPEYIKELARTGLSDLKLSSYSI